MEEESAGDAATASKRHKLDRDESASNCEVGNVDNTKNTGDENQETNRKKDIDTNPGATSAKSEGASLETAPQVDDTENDCDSYSTPTLSSKDSDNTSNNDSGMCSKTSGEHIVETGEDSVPEDNFNITIEHDSGLDVQMEAGPSTRTIDKEDEMIDVEGGFYDREGEEGESQQANIDSDTNTSYAALDDMNPNVVVNTDDNTASSSTTSGRSESNMRVQFNHGPSSSSRSYRQINIEVSLSPPSHQSPVSDVSMNASMSSSMSDGRLTPSEDDEDNDDDDDGNETTASNHETNSADNDHAKRTVEEIMSKEKPAYTWNSTYELMWREHGLAADRRYSLRNGFSPGFNARYYASLHVVERMKLSHTLRKHSGCVNCLNFNRAGDLLCSGSDDFRIIVWDWANMKAKKVFKSGHTENIFQTKFIDTAGSYISIASASRDGQVRRSVIPPAGNVVTECLYKHQGGVHKLVLVPHSNQEIISVGEDGMVLHYDMRNGKDPNRLTKATLGTKERKLRLYSISHHPYAPEYCVSGFYDKVRVYDKRNSAKPIREMYPKDLPNSVTMPQVTCAVYNNKGTEILASYSDDHIYLFDNMGYVDGAFLHRYKGHINHRTIKGVNFFGPNSEYIISGSDCGHIFFWDKHTEAIINYMKGDRMGVVNCLEPHPWIPVLATSGLDSSVKIFTPSNNSYPPDLSELERHVHQNQRRVGTDEHDFDDRQFHYFMSQFLRSRGVGSMSGRRNREDSSSDDEPDMFLWTSSSNSNSSSNNDNEPPLESLRCRTQ